MSATPQYDVFLSYHAPDREAVAYLAQRLQQAGIRPWFDAWALPAGQLWIPHIEQALDSCKGCLVFFGPHGVGKWQQQEAQVALQRSLSADQPFPLIPVLLPGAPRKVPAFLNNFTWVELGASIENETAFQKLVQGIQAGSLAANTAAPAPQQPERATAPRGRANIPEPLTPLIGREAEIPVLETQLRDPDARLVTLTGPGGIGKTRLAIAVARHLEPTFPDGVYYVSLAAIRDPALVAPALAQALGVAEQADRPIAAGIAAWLGNQSLLLVLDNFEQVADAAALLGELLINAPNLHVLVTSRVPLHLLGEHRYILGPLVVPLPQVTPTLANSAKNPAVELFVQRAHALQPQFALTSSNLPTIVDICTRLEGIPLAIELVAAQLRGIYGPKKILAQLDEFMLTWSDGARNREQRHQTMESTIAWSYSLLTEPEQQLFAGMGAFSGGCSPDAVAALCPDEPPELVAELLQSLIDKSLVQGIRHDDDQLTRLDMLEIILAFARERLGERSDANEFRERHAVFFLQLAENAFPNLSGPDQKQLMDELALEHENMREAVRWLLATNQELGALRLTGALWRFWYNRGYLAEGRRQITQAIDLLQAERAQGGPPADPQSSAALALALDGLGSLAQKQGDFQDAIRSYRAALAYYQQLEDNQAMAHTLYRLGLATMRAGHNERARVFLENSLEINTKLHNTLGAARARNNLGMLADYSGDYTTARHHYEHSLALLRELGDTVNIAIGLGNIGEVAFHQGDLAAARENFIASLDKCNQIDDPEGIAYCLDWLAQIAAAQHDRLRAAQIWGAAAALRDARGLQLAPADQKAHTESIQAAREQVAAADWKTAWDAGQRLAREEAVALALQQPAG